MSRPRPPTPPPSTRDPVVRRRRYAEGTALRDGLDAEVRAATVAIMERDAAAAGPGRPPVAIPHPDVIARIVHCPPTWLRRHRRISLLLGDDAARWAPVVDLVASSQASGWCEPSALAAASVRVVDAYASEPSMWRALRVLRHVTGGEAMLLTAWRGPLSVVAAGLQLAGVAPVRASVVSALLASLLLELLVRRGPEGHDVPVVETARAVVVALLRP